MPKRILLESSTLQQLTKDSNPQCLMMLMKTTLWRIIRHHSNAEMSTKIVTTLSVDQLIEQWNNHNESNDL
jgi:hypothetical protein